MTISRGSEPQGRSLCRIPRNPLTSNKEIGWGGAKLGAELLVLKRKGRVGHGEELRTPSL